MMSVGDNYCKTWMVLSIIDGHAGDGDDGDIDVAGVDDDGDDDGDDDDDDDDGDDEGDEDGDDDDDDDVDD